MEYIIRRPTLEDIDFLAKNARELDKKEVFFSSGMNIDDILKSTPNILNDCYVWEINSKLVAMYGISNWGGDNNVIWMLATDEFDKYKNIFRRDCKKIVKEMVNGKNYVYNYIWCEHRKAIKWLKWLGFTILDPEPIGINGELFCKFELRK